jgi:hypothetical protein
MTTHIINTTGQQLQLALTFQCLKAKGGILAVCPNHGSILSNIGLEAGGKVKDGAIAARHHQS